MATQRPRINQTTWDALRTEVADLGHAMDRDKFKTALLRSMGLDGTKAGTVLYDLAWSEGHSADYHEVMMYADEMFAIVQACHDDAQAS